MIPVLHGEPSRGLVLECRLWKSRKGNPVWVGSPAEGFIMMLKENKKEKLWKWELLFGFEKERLKCIQKLRVIQRTDTKETVLMGHRGTSFDCEKGLGFVVVQKNGKQIAGDMMVYKCNVLPWNWENVLTEEEDRDRCQV